MSEENKYLKLARAAREEDNAEDARKYYEMARTEDPENIEARFFYQYYALMDCKNIEIADRYEKLINSIEPTLKMIAKSTLSDSEKVELVTEIVGKTLPLKNVLLDIMYGLKVDGESVLPSSHMSSVTHNGIEFERNLGDKLIAIFGSKASPYTDLAVNLWKERIREFHATGGKRGYKDKGKKAWFDELADKIKVYDPSYVLPEFKQEGCISIG